MAQSVLRLSRLRRLSAPEIQPRGFIARSLIAAVAGFALALTHAGTGHAEPSATEIEAQIDTAWNELEPIIEQYNKVNVEVATDQAKVNELTEQLRPLDLKVDLALGRVSSISVRQYKGGGASVITALLTNGSPAVLVDQVSLLDRLAANEMAEIKDVLDLKRGYDEQKAPLDALLVGLKQQQADLGARKTKIEADIKRLNDMRVRAYGAAATSGGPVKLPAACPAEYTPDAGNKAAKVACDQARAGKWYSFGAGGPNVFDCSGLTMYAWGQAGVKLRHYTKWQYSDTKRVSRAELRPGDLIFYHSDMHHMGMYVGGGWQVDAPHTGAQVRMKRVDDMQTISGYGRPG